MFLPAPRNFRGPLCWGNGRNRAASALVLEAAAPKFVRRIRRQGAVAYFKGPGGPLLVLCHW